MRSFRLLAVVAVLALLIGSVGCSRQVVGAAVPPAIAAPLALSEDGFGVVAGFDTAPAKIEIYTEPQCRHCADLQQDFGDDLAHYIAIGALQVTYRPLTFMDADYQGYSATVANAMFVAAEPVGALTASGTQFQRFVRELWSNQDSGGRPFSGDELRDMALAAGVPEPVAAQVASGSVGIDVVDMDDTNYTFLFEVDPDQTGTPTVFDLQNEQKLDVYDDNWLDDLVAS
ncbi:DsbA family protein [Mycobacterium sp. pV006]|uniref:DsbA family protein n=1 Tax=Mycobacterium sp. pV006 TaxID=3238983 RepID=UPI00351B0B1A